MAYRVEVSKNAETELEELYLWVVGRPHVYRIFFTVDHTAKVVRVVHARRGARQRPTVDELKDE